MRFRRRELAVLPVTRASAAAGEPWRGVVRRVSWLEDSDPRWPHLRQALMRLQPQVGAVWLVGTGVHTPPSTDQDLDLRARLRDDVFTAWYGEAALDAIAAHHHDSPSRYLSVWDSDMDSLDEWLETETGFTTVDFRLWPQSRLDLAHHPHRKLVAARAQRVLRSRPKEAAS